MTDSTFIQVKNLKKYFKSPGGMLHAVDDVSFTIERGKTLGVVGESGCGKSTLGRTVLGLLPATDGQVIFNGENITAASGKKRRELMKNMQLIFQDPFSSLNPRMCVSELIAEPLIAYDIFHHDRRKVEAKVRQLMDLAGLSSRLAYSYPHELDGGRRQRIGVARALALDPEFIVCDEPVSALDVSIQAQILNLLKDLQDAMNLTYIFITHDLSVVKYISDDILVMYLGCVVEKCSSADIFRRQLHPYTKGLLSSIPIPNIHHRVTPAIMEGELSSPIDPPPGCRFAGRCPYAQEACYHVTPQLEEVLPGHLAACHRVQEINHLI